jgi:hypothetical protein
VYEFVDVSGVCFNTTKPLNPQIWVIRDTRHEVPVELGKGSIHNVAELLNLVLKIQRISLGISHRRCRHPEQLWSVYWIENVVKL